MNKGIVLSSIGGNFYVLSKKETIVCRASGKLRDSEQKIIAGDNIFFEKTNKDEGYIKKIDKRKNKLVRPLIANVDQALIVVSLKEPNFSFYLMDKLILQAKDLGLDVVVYLSKKDKLNKKELKKYKEKLSFYTKDGIKIIFGNSLSLNNKKDFKKIIKNKKTVVCGQSGAGKSTLLNALDQKLNIKTGPYSKALGRGKHTTRTVRLIPLFDGLIADTPGFSSLSLDIEKERAAKIFPLFKNYYNDCHFQSSCLHLNAEGCQIISMVKKGKILKETYDSYQKILSEIKEKEEKRYK